MIAFERSFKANFGTETDLRHWDGRLVISHDLPTYDSISFEDVLSVYESEGCTGSLALNIKEDGLQDLLEPFLPRLKNYFLFDMSIPDQRSSLKKGLRCFSRYSDIETAPVYLNESQGLWVDTLDSEWINTNSIKAMSKSTYRCCFVSPELHKRNPIDLWRLLLPYKSSAHFILCTDVPEQAVDFFGDQHD